MDEVTYLVTLLEEWDDAITALEVKLPLFISSSIDGYS